MAAYLFPSSVDCIPGHVAEQFRRGERAAFEEVYRVHAHDVRRWVSKFFKSPFEQEEAVQDSWLLAHRMSQAYDASKGPLGPWLRALVVNRCKELLRAKGRRVQPELDVDEVEIVAGGAGPEGEARRQRVRLAVAQFALDLDEQEKWALEFLLVREMTHEEAAAQMGISVRRSKYLKQKLLAKAAADPLLRAALEEWR